MDSGAHLATKIGDYGTLKGFAYGVAEQYAYRVQSAAVDDLYRYRNRRGFCPLSYEQAWARADLALARGLSVRRADDAVGSCRTTRCGHDAYAAAHYRRYWADAFSTRVGLSYDERRLTVDGEFPATPSADPDQAPAYTATLGRARTLWEAYQYTKLRRGPWTGGLGLRLNALPRPAQPGYVSAQLNLRRDLSARQFLNLSGGQYTVTAAPEALQFPYLRTRTRQLALDYGYARPGLTVAAAVYAKAEHSVVSTRLVGVEAYAERAFGAHFRADVGAAAVRAARSTFNTQDPSAAALARAQRRYNLSFSLKINLRLAGKWGELGAFAQYRAGAPFTPVLGATPDPVTSALQPQYAVTSNAAALPNYFRADFSASKFVRRPNKAGSLVLFTALRNVFNSKNVSGYTYSADYRQATPTLFQRRLLYFGLVKTWQ